MKILGLGDCMSIRELILALVMLQLPVITLMDISLPFAWYDYFEHSKGLNEELMELITFTVVSVVLTVAVILEVMFI